MKQVTLKCIDFYKCIIFILAAWYSVPISFFSVRCLRNHLKTVHLEEKPFKCKFCNCQTSFASEGRLTTHVIRVHSKKMVRLTRFIYNLRIITGKSRLLRFIPILAYIKSSLYHLSTLLFSEFSIDMQASQIQWFFTLTPFSKKRCQSTPLSTFHLKRKYLGEGFGTFFGDRSQH